MVKIFSACFCHAQDARREMAAFIPILWSKIREGKQSFCVVQCETHTNTVHTDQTDDDSLQQQQVLVSNIVLTWDCAVFVSAWQMVKLL